jgi:hypothetical protein
LRRTGKTTFLCNDLVPELESQAFRKGVDQSGDRAGVSCGGGQASGD